MQPINQNNALSNHHVYVVGMSGCGKTSAAKKLFIKPTDQVAIFDPIGDYEGQLAGRKVRSYASLKAFAAALIAGRKTNQGFKIAYYPNHETLYRKASRKISINSAWWFGAWATASTRNH
ncbi:hypothetical protein DFP78_11620 [Photobacterium lutimaris]|nr:hypothetical protein DFP78_11620 [Photobacterium lutimaris]